MKFFNPRFLHATFALLALFGACLIASPLTAQDDGAPPAEAEAAPSETEGAASGEEAEAEAVMEGASLFERLGQGGVTMLFIAVLSVSALTFALERALNLKKAAINPEALLNDAKRLWSEGEYDAILKRTENDRSALAKVIHYLVEHRTASTLELSTIAGDIAGRSLRGHLQKAYPLAIIATIAPLLGLFGTVLGMIDSFEVVAIAGSLGDASLLAGGISKALVTTAGGLALAIPALGAYHYFKSRTNTHAMALERDVNDLLTTWFMKKA
ncbi:MAG: MotA/TolQ/ExbB proton channel family protein [Opitutales bacterium]